MKYTHPYGHGKSPLGVRDGKPGYSRPSLAGMTQAQVRYVQQLEREIAQMRHDESWRKSAEHAARTGGTL